MKCIGRILRNNTWITSVIETKKRETRKWKTRTVFGEADYDADLQNISNKELKDGAMNNEEE